MNVHPNNLELLGDSQLLIAWSDGQVREYSLQELRDQCPCATCREKRSNPTNPLLQQVLTPGERVPLKIKGMAPIGNYAYTISFSDGHETGIYDFDLLLKLGKLRDATYEQQD